MIRVPKARNDLGIRVLAALLLAACGGWACGRGSETSTQPGSAPAARAAGDQAQPAPRTSRPRIVALGDSLTAGLGLASDEAYPALLQEKVDRAGLNYEVVNAGVSGDTSAGGLSRADWALEGDVRVLIVALGGNDALRGLPPESLRDNLAAIIERGQRRGATVLLAGMEAPPNFGRDYIVEFHQVYPDLARKYHVAFVPFLLDRVAGIDGLNQRDGIHPTAEGARIVADTVWKVLRPMLQ